MKSKQSRKIKELPFQDLFDKFIEDSIRKRRIQPNGKALCSRTIATYGYTAKLIREFVLACNFYLRLKQVSHLSLRELRAERNYWKKFYRKFTDYLYGKRGFYDNYVGHIIKNLKVFFSYLNKDLLLDVGVFYKSFYVRKEEIAIVVLMPEELNYLIYDKAFELTLTPTLRRTKDIFVFGCTVALRVSDLLNLYKTNLRIVNDRHYLVVRSKKKGTSTQVCLPEYAVEIIKKYQGKYNTLLPPIHKVNLNLNLKALMERAGFTQPLTKIRERRGMPVEINRKRCTIRNYRFCDLVSTHTMRRTAITTMLCLGMPEILVRTISGHTPASKEFFRYVMLAQSYQDRETSKMFESLRPLLCSAGDKKNEILIPQNSFKFSPFLIIRDSAGKLKTK